MKLTEEEKDQIRDALRGYCSGTPLQPHVEFVIGHLGQYAISLVEERDRIFIGNTNTPLLKPVKREPVPNDAVQKGIRIGRVVDVIKNGVEVRWADNGDHTWELNQNLTVLVIEE